MLLIVDVISLCQSYKYINITKIKWIYRHHNPANFMIKANLSLAFKTLIKKKCININTTKEIEWVNIK